MQNTKKAHSKICLIIKSFKSTQNKKIKVNYNFIIMKMKNENLNHEDMERVAGSKW